MFTGQADVPGESIGNEVASPDGAYLGRSSALAFAIVVTLIAVMCRFALTDQLDGQPTLVLFTLPIMLSAYVGGARAGLLATALSLLAASYFFLPPTHSFAIRSPADRWQQAFVAIAGMVISGLSEALHDARRRAAAMARRHRAAEFALAASEARYRTLIDWNPYALAVHWAGRVRFVNAAAVRLFGATSAAELTGMPIVDLIHPRDRDFALARVKRQEEEGVDMPPARETFQTVRGEAVDVEVTSTSITFEGQRAILSAITDIRDRIAQEDEKERLARLYEALSRVNHAIVRTPKRDVLFERVCQALVEAGGLSVALVRWRQAGAPEFATVAERGDSAGLACLSRHVDALVDAAAPTIATVAEPSAHVCNDTLAEPSLAALCDAFTLAGLRSFAVFPVRQGGVMVATLNVCAAQPGFFQAAEVSQLVNTVIDISYALDSLAHADARARAEHSAAREKAVADETLAALRESELRLNRAQAIAHLGSWELEIASGGLQWSDEIYNIFGTSPDRFGASYDAFISAVHPDDRDAIARATHAATSGGESLNLEHRIVRPDGSLRWVHEVAELERTSDATPLRLTGTVLDITERKETTDQLHAAREHLERRVAERTAELQAAYLRAESADHVKSAFLATMSHELRTPLNSIIGFTSVVLNGMAGPLNTEQTKQLGMVRGSARHLLELVNDVLDLSKIEAGQLIVRSASFAPHLSFTRIVESVRPLADRKGLSVSLDSSVQGVEMVSDRRRVEQILLNLLGNAVKFTEHGGVTVTATIIGAPESWLQLQVQDTGIGMSSEGLSTLFEPFRQIDSGLARQSEGKGTGLGLAISSRLASLLGGHITVSSEPSRGSVFTVTLPLHMS